MSDYSGSGGNLQSADRGRLMEQVRNQIAVASAQELIQKISDKCFRKCISYPGAELDSREQRHLIIRNGRQQMRLEDVYSIDFLIARFSLEMKCLSLCMDRYMEAWNITSRTYNNRLQKDRHGL